MVESRGLPIFLSYVILHYKLHKAEYHTLRNERLLFLRIYRIELRLVFFTRGKT